MRNAATPARLHWILTGAGCVAVGLAALVLAVRGISVASTGDALPLAPDGPVAPLHAILVVREDACESALDFAHVFERPHGLRVILEGTFTLASRRQLIAALGSAPVSAMVVYDSTRTVRMVLELPVSVQSADLLVKWVVKGSGEAE